MSQLEWKETYSVGIKELDQQHKGLLELVNRVCNMDPATLPKNEAFAILNTLINYAQTHFETEERLLQTHDYPHLAQQQREHVAFTAEVFKLAQQLEKNDPHLHRQITDFVKNWYISHILGTDREYKDFLLSKGEA